MRNILIVYRFLTSYEVFLLCVFGIVAGLPLSKFLMSVGGISISVQWLIQGNFIKKFGDFFTNKLAVITWLTFAVFVLGLIHTQNFDYGLKDIRVKLPLLAFPVVLSTHYKIKKQHFVWILVLFVFATFVSSLYSYLAYMEIITPKKAIHQVRDISQFISHIRLSLMVVFSMFLLPFLAKKNTATKIIALLVFFWFSYFLSLIESATGFIIGGITLFAVSLYLFYTQKTWEMLVPFGLAICLFFILGIKLYKTYLTVKLFDAPTENTLTASGNKYDTNNSFIFFDNGNYSNEYLCEIELRNTWGTVSAIHYDSVSRNGGAIKFNLIRYLTSKGHKKDKEGVLRLTKEDIYNIEEGIPNYLLADNDLMNRLYLIMFEVDGYFEGANVNGNSLSQRLVYWKISKEIGNESFWFGQGTGDVADAFDKKYDETTILREKYQLRSHNQYLSTFIAIGFIGVFIFLLSLILPFQFAIKQHNYLYVVFACIAFISFFSEDTLETQVGVFFFSFFNSLLLFQTPKDFLKNTYHVRQRRGKRT